MPRLCPPPPPPPASPALPAADWTFVADASGGWATHFRFQPSWGANASLSRGHLVNRLSRGCVNLRSAGSVRGHSNGSPQNVGAPPSDSTELVPSPELAAFHTLRSRAAASSDASSGAGGCVPPPAASFQFVAQGTSKEPLTLQAGADGLLAAARGCPRDSCRFQLLPAGEGGAGWFQLRSLSTGRLVRLAHAAMPTEASWGGARPPFARPKQRPPRARARRGEAACPIGAGAADSPAGWRYNATLWGPVVAAALAPWAEGELTASVLDLAFSPHMYPAGRRHALPGLHVSVREGRLYYRANSDYRLTLVLDMLRTVARLVRLPDVEFVAHLWDHPKVPRQHPLPVLAHYVDVAHRDIAMPAPWSWDDKAHRWPQPFSKLRSGGCPKPYASRKPLLYFRGGCNGPTRGWRGPIWQFYPRKRANIHTASRPGAVDAGTYDHCDSPKLNKHEWGWDAEMEKEMRARGPKRKIEPFAANCGYRYLLHVDGNVASSRLASEMHLGATIFKQDSFSSEHFYPLLRPWRHYVPVDRSLADLDEKYRWANANAREAEEIGRRAQAFAREHLHTGSVACYWWQLLSALADLQPFVPRTGADLGFRPA